MRPGFMLAAVVVLAAACDRGDPEPAPTHVTFALRSSGAPLFGDVPFPSDLYRAGGRLIGDLPGLDRVVGAHADAIQRGLGALDGFGRTTASFFCVDGALDASSLVDGAALLVDIDPASPNRGRRLPLSLRWLEGQGCVAALPAPGTVLDPGVQYAAVLTRAVRDTRGRAIAPDPRFSALLASADRSSPAEMLYGGAVDELLSLKQIASRDEVAGLTVFTTSRAVFELPALRDRVRATTPRLLLDDATPYRLAIFGTTTTPSLDDWLGVPTKDESGRDWPGLDNAGGVPHDAIGVIASAAYEATSFLDPKTKSFVRGSDGAFAIADPRARVPVTIVIPKAPAGPSGYPIVIAGHGLGGTRNNMLAVANEFARAGFVTVGIDDVAHGARRGTPDNKSNYQGTYRGPDGIPDSDQIAGLDFFAGFTDLLAIRDNFRQTALDHVALVKLLQDPSLDLSKLGVTAPGLDPARIYWSGGSFGGIIGTVTTAIEPEIRASALHVPGGGWVHLVLTASPQMAGLAGALVRTTYQTQTDDTIDRFHPLTNLVQQVVEAGDPLTMAPHVLRAPFEFEGKPRARASNVLLTWALDDEVLPNVATIALIRALGLSSVGPTLQPIEGVADAPSPFAGSGAVQYAPAVHALGYQRWGERTLAPGKDLEDRASLPKKITIEMPLHAHLEQVIHFFDSTAAGRSEIVVKAGARADFDGDGAPDDKDPAPFDPSGK